LPVTLTKLLLPAPSPYHQVTFSDLSAGAVSYYLEGTLVFGGALESEMRLVNTEGCIFQVFFE
jgi:hypothetical protein